MEDANGRLSISEGSVFTIGRKSCKAGSHEGLRMEPSEQKGTRYHTAMPGSVGGFQYLKGEDNRRCDEGIG